MVLEDRPNDPCAQTKYAAAQGRVLSENRVTTGNRGHQASGSRATRVNQTARVTTNRTTRVNQAAGVNRPARRSLFSALSPSVKNVMRASQAALAMYGQYHLHYGGNSLRGGTAVAMAGGIEACLPLIPEASRSLRESAARLVNEIFSRPKLQLAAAWAVYTMAHATRAIVSEGHQQVRRERATHAAINAQRRANMAKENNMMTSWLS